MDLESIKKLDNKIYLPLLFLYENQILQSIFASYDLALILILVDKLKSVSRWRPPSLLACVQLVDGVCAVDGEEGEDAGGVGGPGQLVQLAVDLGRWWGYILNLRQPRNALGRYLRDSLTRLVPKIFCFSHLPKTDDISIRIIPTAFFTTAHCKNLIEYCRLLQSILNIRYL